MAVTSLAGGGVRHRGAAHGRKRWRGGRHFVLVPLAALMLVPAYLLFVNVFKPQDEILSNPFGVPFSRLSAGYLGNAFDNPSFSFLHAYWISGLIAAVTVALTIVVGGPLAYRIARGRGHWHRVLFGIFVVGTFVPSQVILIPVVFLLRAIGLQDSLIGLFLYTSALSLPITVFLYTGYIRSIPRELDEAAMVDGAGLLRAFWSVIFPTVRPATATIMILTGVGAWNDFVDPLTILGPATHNYTVTTGIYTGIGQFATNFNMVYPDVLLAILPALIFFLFLQRRFVSGLTSGAVK